MSSLVITGAHGIPELCRVLVISNLSLVLVHSPISERSSDSFCFLKEESAYFISSPKSEKPMAFVKFNHSLSEVTDIATHSSSPKHGKTP